MDESANISFEKMEVVNAAEKEASEVLHSLLSVERRTIDSKEAIIVSIPPLGSNETNGSAEYVGENAQWHTPVMGQHSVFEMTAQGLQPQQYNGQNQVIWQGHTIQVGEHANLEEMNQSTMSEMYNLNMDTQEIEEVKPKLEKKSLSRKKRKQDENESDDSNDEESRNKLEDNPMQVKARLKRGCECKDNCYRGLNPDSVYKHRLNIAELSKSEHDMYLMGITMASLANPSETSRHKVRRRLRACYVYQGRKVCLEAFLYLENVTHYQLKRIRQHVMTHGVAPRVHGNVGKKPYNTFTLDIYKHATNFMKEYLKQHTSSMRDVQPAGENGKRNSKAIIIQGDSRKNLFEAYKEYGEILEPGVKLMGYSTFRQFMKDQFPHVKFLTKKQDAVPKEQVPFRSGKCMSYDKNKDPVRIAQEKEKAEAKKAAMEAKKKAEAEEQAAHQQAQQQAAAQQQAQQQAQHHHNVNQQQQQQQQQQQHQTNVVIHQQPQQMQQHVMVSQQSQHTLEATEMTPQVIPLAVVQNPQQTYIVTPVTPVSHFQTRVQGAWYRQH